ncbi:MAG: putative secreted protein [Pseudomonas sp.]|nr:putative secreted protein [Pseudomonas sp.]
MNVKTALIAIALASLSISAMADDSDTTAKDQNTPVEVYSYNTHPDIVKVISTTEPGNVCGAVPVEMVYEDSAGQRHRMQYQAMGSGCDHG